MLGFSPLAASPLGDDGLADVSASISISAAASVIVRAGYVLPCSPQIAANSNLVAQMRLKWEDAEAQPEIWTPTGNTAGTWVPQAAHGETWSTIGSMAA